MACSSEFKPKTILRVAFIAVWLAVFIFNKAIASGSIQPDRQAGIVVENATVAVSFGRQISFLAIIKAPIPIQQVSILFRGVDEAATRVEIVPIAEDGSTIFTYDASLNVFPPFSYIVFWYQALLSDGNIYTSGPITFRYDDNRFPWQTASRDNVNVHWYAGDAEFGANALDAAYRGSARVGEYFSTGETPVEIYIYSNEQDLEQTMILGGESWAGGHANPGLGVAFVAIAPGEAQAIEMENEIPHELAHIAMYRVLGNKYDLQPLWLREGIAKSLELNPSPDEAQALKIASEKGALLQMEDLCASFPADAGSAYLAYAQSRSFTTYLRDTYGTSGLMRLVGVYGDGFNCELGAANALGSPLSQLDIRWRENVLGQNVYGVAANNLAPFVLLMVLVMLVPFWGAMDLVLKRRRHA